MHNHREMLACFMFYCCSPLFGQQQDDAIHELLRLGGRVQSTSELDGANEQEPTITAVYVLPPKERIIERYPTYSGVQWRLRPHIDELNAVIGLKPAMWTEKVRNISNVVDLLDRFPELKKVDFTFCELSDEHMNGLVALTQIEELILSNTDVTGEGLAAIGSLASLEKLDLSDTDVSDGIEVLSGLNNLHYLNLGGVPDLAGRVTFIRECDELKELCIHNTNVDDESAKVIASLRDITSLELSNTRIGDSAISTLATLASLEHLSITDNALSDAAIEAIAKFPKLKWIDIHNSGITHEGITLLSRLRPNLEIAQDRNPSLKKLHRTPKDK